MIVSVWVTKKENLLCSSYEVYHCHAPQFHSWLSASKNLFHFFSSFFFLLLLDSTADWYLRAKMPPRTCSSLNHSFHPRCSTATASASQEPVCPRAQAISERNGRTNPDPHLWQSSCVWEDRCSREPCLMFVFPSLYLSVSSFLRRTRRQKHYSCPRSISLYLSVPGADHCTPLFPFFPQPFPSRWTYCTSDARAPEDYCH